MHGTFGSTYHLQGMSRVHPLLLSVACLAACSGPTQLVVVVDTNLEVPSEIDTVEVIITDPDGLQTVVPQSVSGPGDPGFPLTISVSPESDRLGPISVAAIGRLGGVEVVRVTATELALLPGESRTLHLLLLRSCVGRMCPPDRTCGAGGCSRAAVEVSGLAVWDGTPPPFDESDPCIAMPWDVDGDGQGDVECGGMDCDDAEPLAYDGATEECNGFDDNCDGAVDEDCACAPLGMMEGCTTSCGSMGARICEMSGWASCAPPAETCNGLDDDCDGVADDGIDYVAGTPVNVTSDPVDPGEHSNEPVVAWTGDRYGIAWHDELAGAGTHFATLDATGALTSPLLFLGPGRTPSIAFGGGVFAVAWWQQRVDAATMAITDRVYFRIVGTDAAAVTDMVRIEDDADADPRPRVVWDGSAFAVSYRDGGLFYHRFAPDGAEIGSRVPVPATDHERADFAFDGTVYALAWNRSGNLYFTRGSDTAGFPMDATVVASGVDAEGAGMAPAGRGYLIAWRSVVGTRPVQALVLDATGAPAGMPITLSPTGSRRDLTQFPNRFYVEVVAAPLQTFVVWVDARDGDRGLYVARLAPDGTIVQAGTRISDVAPTASGAPSGTWADDRFTVVWEENMPFTRAEVLFNTFSCP